MKSCDTTIRIRYGETDQMGVVYHSNYFRYFEVGRSSLFRDIGYTYKRFEEEGFMLPLIHCDCSFKQPAKYDDEVIIRTTISALKGVRVTLHYQALKIEDDKEVILVTGSTTHAFVDSHMKPVNIKKVNPDFYALATAE